MGGLLEEALQKSRDEAEDQPHGHCPLGRTMGPRRPPPLTPGEEFAVSWIQVHVTSTGV